MKNDFSLKLDIHPVTLHFKRPAGTSRGVYTERRLWRIHVTSPSQPRMSGWGECAPLYDLSPDYDAGYATRLRTICDTVERTGRVDCEALRPHPSILFALETAMLSARASLKYGDSLHLYDTPFTRGEAGIRINGLVWMGTHDEMLQRMEEKLRAGFGCVKLKIGAIDFESEMDLIRTLRRRFGPETVELRVDANGAFAADDALHKLDRLAQYHIHSIEQPIRAGAWNEMARLCRLSPLPIALDEELIGINDPETKVRLLDTIRPQYIILKPTLHGGLSGAEEWIRMADERGIGRWVTSALESNLGLNAIAAWTSTLPAGRDGEMPQGLGTGALFTTNYDPAQLAVEGDRLWIAPEETRRFRDRVNEVRRSWRDSSVHALTARTSGSTGRPQTLHIYKERMEASARRTIAALDLRPGDEALLCMPVDYIAGQMMVVRAEVGALQLTAVPPSLHPLAGRSTAPQFIAMTPMQAFETLAVPAEAEVLRHTPRILIGGGAVSAQLEAQLAALPGQVWSSYGMTETLSHIALRRIGTEGYRPLPGVEVGLTDDGRLTVNDPATCDRTLVTNDLAEMTDDGRFRIIGRRDNVVCSGGLKFHLEQLEALLADLPYPTQLTATPHPSLGEALTLLYLSDTVSREEVEAACRQRLPRHAVPRKYLALKALPLTETGKPARAAARKLAETAK